MFYLNPSYLLFVGPGLLLAIIATVMTRTTFNRYARVGTSSGLTGAQAAQRMLSVAGVGGVVIEQTNGFLSDHYDPSTNTLRLSPGVYGSDSLSAVGVACHEAGHALQKAHGYAPLGLRTALVPVASIGSNLSWWILGLGFLLRAPMLVMAGLALFALAVAFTIITLPVEWNASARAKELMVRAGIVTPQEQVHAARVLNAAFMTYVASAITSVLTFLYYLTRSGLLGGRRS